MMYDEDVCPRYTDGWTELLPPWAGKGRDRGLMCWGSRVSKKNKRPRTWEVPGICRSAILAALLFWCSTIGLPPVVTGILPTGRVKKKKKFGSGHTKGQIVLVPAPESERIDLLRTFLFVVSVVYCMELRPAVDEGTEAEMAVLATLAGDNARLRYLCRVVFTSFTCNLCLYVLGIHPAHTSWVYILYIHPVHTCWVHIPHIHPVCADCC